MLTHQGQIVIRPPMRPSWFIPSGINSSNCQRRFYSPSRSGATFGEQAACTKQRIGRCPDKETQGVAARPIQFKDGGRTDRDFHASSAAEL
jgi:hypothetical protein